MTPNSPNSPRDDLEARLTALLLGELSADEAAALRETIAQDPQLARLHDRLQQTIEIVRATSASPELQQPVSADAPRLSAERREKLLTTFKVIRSKEPRRLRWPTVNWGQVRWREWGALATMLMVLLVVGAGLAKRAVAPLKLMEMAGESEDEYIGAAITTLPAAAPASEVGRSENIFNWNVPGATPASRGHTTRFAGSTPPASPPLRDIRLPVGGKPPAEPAAIESFAVVPPPPPAMPPVLSPAPMAVPQDSSGHGVAHFGAIALPSMDDAVQDKAVRSRELERITPLAQNGAVRNRFRGTDLKQGELQLSGGYGVAAGIAGGRPVGGLGGERALREIADKDSPGPSVVNGPTEKGLGAEAKATKPPVLAAAPVAGEPAPDFDRIGVLGMQDAGVAPKTPGKENEVQVKYYVNSNYVRSTSKTMPATNAAAGDRRVLLASADKDPMFSGGAPFGNTLGIDVLLRRQNGMESLAAPVTTYDTAPGGVREAKGVDYADDARGFAVTERSKSSVESAPTLGVLSTLGRMFTRTPTTPKPSDLKLFLSKAATPPAPADAKESLADGRNRPSEYAGVPIATGARLFDTEAGQAGRGSNRESDGADRGRLKSKQLLDEDRLRRSGVEIALPEGARTEAREKLQVATGPVVAGEVFYSDLATGLPAPQRGAEEAVRNSANHLDGLQTMGDRLQTRLWQENVDRAMPRSGAVEIIDRAESEPARKPTLWTRMRNAVSGEVERTAKVSAEKEVGDTAGLGGPHQRGYDPYWKQTQAETIQSKEVLGKVIDKLNLNEEWAGRHGTGDKLKTEDTIALLKKKIDVRMDPSSSLIDIKARSENPEEAARIANAVAEAYRDTREERLAQQSALGRSVLEAELKKVDQQLEQAKAEPQQELIDFVIPIKSAQATDVAQALGSLTGGTSVTVNKRGVGQQTRAGLSAGGSSSFAQRLNQTVNRAANGGGNIGDAVQTKIIADERSNSLLIFASKSDFVTISNAIQKLDRPAPKLAAGAPIPQPEIVTSENAFSTFSLNVSDVSFKLAAASLEKGQMPDPATVRSEEFINAFDYRDPEPKGSAPIAFAWERARYPFAHDRDLVRFSVKTAASGRQPGRPLNLVLLLDNSGSMERADRVRIREACLRVLASQLRPGDRVSLIAFARTARLVVDGIDGGQAAQVPQWGGGLSPDGGTNLEEAMNLAYQTARRHFLAQGVNRVVLLTDGAANLGNVDPEAFKQKVEAHRRQGVALDCFGIGWDGLNDELLEVLSRNGDGRYGFVNTPEAASSEFAGQLAGALKVAASDVKVQVEWNPRRVTAYRQIGYAKHQLKKEQFRDNTVDAAEIGAAEAGNALYVVQVNPAGEGPLGVVRVRFKVPGTSDYREHEWPLRYDGSARPLEQAGSALRLAASASAFSEWLVSSPHAGEVTPDQLLGLLSGVPEKYSADPRPKKLEWMIRQARSVAGK